MVSFEEYIGTGPYKFTEWQQDQYIRLDKFDDYVAYGTEGEQMDGWAGYKAAPTKTLIFNYVPEATTRKQDLRRDSMILSIMFRTMMWNAWNPIPTYM